MQTPKLTPEITRRRIQYLKGQHRRGNIVFGKDVEKKIRSNLPVREHEVDDLREAFMDVMRNDGYQLCDECGVISRYLEEIGGIRLCSCCEEEYVEEEE